MPRRVGDFRGLTQANRLRLLRAVQRHPGRGLTWLAETAGMALSTARDHLRVLEDEGFVTTAVQDTGRAGRPPKAYFPVRRAADSQAAEHRTALARDRGERLRALDPGLDPTVDLCAEAVHQLDVLYEHLEDAGMDPAVDAAALTVEVLPCVYQRLLDTDRALVCSVHAVLVRDQLDQVPGPLELRRLHPVEGPDHCLLVLARRGEPLRTSRRGGVDPAADDESALQAAAARSRRTGRSGRSGRSG